VSSVQLKLEGFRELQEQLEKLKGLTARKVLASAAGAAMKPVLEGAREKVPVESGALRDSLRLAVRTQVEGAATAVEAGVSARRGKVSGEIEIAEGLFEKLTMHWAGWRWHFAELGTSRQRAHPFLRPAMDERKETVLAILKDRLTRGIQRALARQDPEG